MGPCFSCKLFVQLPITICVFTVLYHACVPISAWGWDGRVGQDTYLDRLGFHFAYHSKLSPLVGAVTVISPLELIRTKMQSRPLSYRELRVCIQSSVAQDGWLSLWKGWGPTVLRDVPFSGMDVSRGNGGQGQYPQRLFRGLIYIT